MENEYLCAIIHIIKDYMKNLKTGIMKYIIKFKEQNREWQSTSYTCQEPVSEEYLVRFFGLYEDDVEEYLIEVENK